LKRGSIKDSRDSIKTARNEQPFSRRVVKDTLWLGQIWDGVDRLAGFQVDDFKRVVLNGGDEESLTSYINAEVINSPSDVGEGNLRFKRQPLGLLACELDTRNEQHAEHK